MTRRVQLMILTTAILAVVVPVLWWGTETVLTYRTKHLYHKAQSEWQKKYAYHVSNGNIRRALFGVNANEGRKLVNYYRKLNSYFHRVEERKEHFSEAGDSIFFSEVTSPVPMRLISPSFTVYVPEFIANDSVVRGFYFDTVNWEHREVFFAAPTIHDTAAPDSLVVQ